jgi:hypothetical protein
MEKGKRAHLTGSKPTKHPGPVALAEEGSKQKGNTDWNTKIQELDIDGEETNGAQVTADLKTEYMEDISEDASTFATTAAAHEQGIDSVMADSESYRETSVQESDDLTSEAQKGIDILNTEEADLDELSRRGMATMADEVDSHEDAAQELVDENEQTVSEELKGAVSADIQETKDEQLGLLETSLEDSKEEQKAVREGLKETTGEVGENAAEHTELKDELEDLLKEQRSLIKTATKTHERSILRAEKIARKTRVAVSTKTSKEEGKAEKAVSRALKDVSKEFKVQTKEWLTKGNELADATSEKADELGDIAGEVKTGFYEQVRATRKENAAAIMDLKSTTASGKKAEADAQDDFNTQTVRRKKMIGSNRYKLSQVADGAKQKIMSIRGELEGQQKLMSSSVGVALTGLEDKIRTSMREDRGKVEQTVRDSGTKLGTKITKGTSTLDKGMFAVIDAAKKLGNEIEDNTGELQDMEAKLSDGAERLNALYETTLKQMGSVSNETKTKLEKVEDMLMEKVQEVENRLVLETGTMKNDTQELAEEKIAADLAEKIETIKEDSVSSLDRSGRTVKTATERGESIVQGMAITSQSIQDLKSGINEELPQAKSSIAQSIGTMKEALSTSEEKLGAGKDAALETVEGQEVEMKAETNAILAESRYKLGSRVEESAQELEEMLRSATTGVDELQETSKSNDGAMKKFDAAQISIVNEALNKVKSLSKQQAKDASTMKDKLGQLKAYVHSLTMNAVRGTQMMKAQSDSVLGNAVMDFTKKAKNAFLNAGGASSDDIKKFLEQATLQLDEKLENLNAKLFTKGQDVKALAASSSGEGEAVTLARVKAAGLMSNFQKKLEQMEEYINELNEKAAKDYSKQEANAKEDQDLLESTSKQEIAHLMEDADAEGKQAQSEAQVAIDKVEQSAEELDRQASSSSTEYGEKVRSRLHTAQEGKGEVTAEVDDLETDERDMEKAMNVASGDLKSKVDVKEDEVKRLEVGEKEQMAEAGGAGVGELRQAAQLLSSAKDLTGAEMDEIGESVQSGLNEYRGVGQEEAKDLTDKVNQLMKTQPDFGAMFDADTGDLREQMASAHDHIDVGQKWAKEVVEGFEGKVEKVREQREQAGSDIHDKASAVKKDVVEQGEDTVKRIGTVAKDTTAMEKNMREKIKEFRGTLSGLSQVESTHDKDQVDEMQAKLFALQQNHERIMSWANMDRHRTAAWKHAVEKNLHELGRSITSDDTEQYGERLDAETSLMNGLRDIAGQVKAEIAKTGQEESKMYEHLASKFGQGMVELMKQKESNEKDEERAQESARESVLRKEESEEKSVGTVKTAQDRLDDTVTTLLKESKVAAGTMAALKLPLLSVNEKNQKTRESYDALKTRLNRMVAAGTMSFLQEADNSNSTAASTANEIQAITALNKLLLRQNMKLAKQNDVLEQGLQYAKSLPTPA